MSDISFQASMTHEEINSVYEIKDELGVKNNAKFLCALSSFYKENKNYIVKDKDVLKKCEELQKELGYEDYQRLIAFLVSYYKCSEEEKAKVGDTGTYSIEIPIIKKNEFQPKECKEYNDDTKKYTFVGKSIVGCDRFMVELFARKYKDKLCEEFGIDQEIDSHILQFGLYLYWNIEKKEYIVHEWLRLQKPRENPAIETPEYPLCISRFFPVKCYEDIPENWLTYASDMNKMELEMRLAPEI